MRSLFVCAVTAAFASVAVGQEFEVVSIKPNKSMSGSSHSRSDQGMLTATNVSLRSWILRAYGLKDYQVVAPDWLGSEQFDVVAKFAELPKDPEKSDAAMRAMLQKMLADRFKLAVHRDQKTFPVYGLTVAKSGIKFKEAPPSDSHSSNSDNGHYTGTCVTMATFAEFLARRTDLPVIDMTGLKGFYNLTLDGIPNSRRSGDGAADTPPAPTLADVVQDQLGLKLESRKAPIEILIVDHAEKSPTEN